MQLCEDLIFSKKMQNHCPISSHNSVTKRTSHRFLLSSKRSTFRRWGKPHLLSPFPAKALSQVTSQHIKVHIVLYSLQPRGQSQNTHTERAVGIHSPHCPSQNTHTALALETWSHLHRRLSQHDFSTLGGERKVKEKTSRALPLMLPLTYSWPGIITTFPSLSIYICAVGILFVPHLPHFIVIQMNCFTSRFLVLWRTYFD